MPTICEDLCISCGLCARVCSMGVITWADGVTTVHPERTCMGCWHCAAICPKKAIREEGLDLYPPAPDTALARLVSMRRSARHFLPQPPDQAVIAQALERAAWAPSAKNLQDYAWTVLYGPEQVEALRTLVLEWAAGQPRFQVLTKLVKGHRDPLTCGCTCILLGHTGNKGNFGHTDTVIAAATAELLLFEQGVGTCWGGYLTSAVNACPTAKEFLGIPAEHEVCAVLLAGIPDKEPYCSVPCRPAPAISWK